MLAAPSASGEDVPPPPPAPRKRQNRKNRKKSRQRQAAKHTPDAAPSSPKYDKAVRRVERAEQKAKKARADLPVKRRLSIQPEPDSETGKPRRRLHFEQEVLPEYRPPSLPARAGGMAKTAAVMKVHGKIHESERQNVAVEATHKSEKLYQ